MTAAGGDVQVLTRASHVVGRPAVAPNGRTLAYARFTAQGRRIVLLDLEDGTSWTLSDRDASEPAFGPRSDELVVRSTREGADDLFVVDVATGAHRAQVTSGAAVEGTPALAPRGGASS